MVHFDAEVDGRKIEAKLKERQEAKQEYDEAIAENKTAFLLEETRSDLFQIKVGHLKPGAGAKIALKYVTELPAEEGHVRLSVPTTIAPRYTPPEYLLGYQDETGDAAKKVAGIKYQWETPAPLTIKLRVRSSSEIKGVESPSHAIKQGEGNKNEDGFYTCDCSLEASVTDMDRDFIALVRTDDIHKPRLLIEESETSKAAMLSLVPSFNLKEQPVELVFLVDRSGSMEGSGIEQAKKALQFLLHSLPTKCLFNIFSFGCEFSSLFDESVAYDDETLAKAKEHVSSMDADFGGTEIFAPLAKILKDEPKEGFVRQVFVLTDGSVFNDKEIIAMVKRNNANGRVFGLGLGDGCSKNLVRGIAKAGLGTAAFAADGEDLRPRVMAQLKNALQPAMKTARVEWIGSNPDQTTKLSKLKEIALAEEASSEAKLTLGQCPANLPPIYDGSRLLVFRIFSNDEPTPRAARVIAMTPDGELTAEVPVEKAVIKGKAVHQMAAKKRVTDLEEIQMDLKPIETPLSMQDESSDEDDGEYEKRLEERRKEREAEEERLKPSMGKIKKALVKIGLEYGLASSATRYLL